MIYAVMKSGVVVNRIELDPKNEAEFAKASGLTLVADADNKSQIGGTYDGSAFADAAPPPPPTPPANRLTPDEIAKLRALIK